jgi:hypothetical protein
MKGQISVAATILVILLVMLSCAKPYHPYVPDTRIPRMIYMEDDVQNLQTVAGKLSGRMVYVQVTTRKGVTEVGKLLRIGEDDVVLSPGYYYSVSGESTGKVDIEKLIPKNEILLLKVF